MAGLFCTEIVLSGSSNKNKIELIIKKASNFEAFFIETAILTKDVF